MSSPKFSFCADLRSATFFGEIQPRLTEAFLGDFPTSKSDVDRQILDLLTLEQSGCWLEFIPPHDTDRIIQLLATGGSNRLSMRLLVGDLTAALPCNFDGSLWTDFRILLALG